MLIPEQEQEAAERGAAWGKHEAEIAADQGIAPAWQNGRYCGWLPEGDDRDEYERILDRAAKTAYEAAQCP